MGDCHHIIKKKRMAREEIIYFLEMKYLGKDSIPRKWIIALFLVWDADYD